MDRGAWQATMGHDWATAHTSMHTQGPRRRGVTQYLPFCNWFISLGMKSSRFVHVVVGIRILGKETVRMGWGKVNHGHPPNSCVSLILAWSLGEDISQHLVKQGCWDGLCAGPVRGMTLIQKKFFKNYLFIWLHLVLVATCELLSCDMGSSSPTRDWTQAPCTGSSES